MELQKTRTTTISLIVGIIVYYDDESSEWVAFSMSNGYFEETGSTKYEAIRRLTVLIKKDMDNPEIPFNEIKAGGDIYDVADRVNELDDFEKIELAFNCIEFSEDDEEDGDDEYEDE